MHAPLRLAATALLAGGAMALAAPPADIAPAPTPPQQPQQKPPVAPAPATPAAPATGAESKKPAAPPSLDDLLELDEADRDRSAAEAAERERAEDLQRELSEEEVASNFALAVEKMALSAELLDEKFDPGLGTQRVQEDIIAKLQQLIEQAKKQQQKGGQSSSSSTSRQNNPQQNPGQRQNEPAPGSERTQNPTDTQEGDPPPMQEGDVNGPLEEGRSEWGNLPQRIRDQMVQGRQSKFSILYKKLTEEYYKRLAEENAP